MEKIANVAEMKRGESIDFVYQGAQAVLVRTKGGRFAAYSTACPHEGGNIVWRPEINKLVCECHLSLFNVEDGSVYMLSSLIKHIDALTPIGLEIDENKNAYAR